VSALFVGFGWVAGSIIGTIVLVTMLRWVGRKVLDAYDDEDRARH
jgi:hypothetical protein